MNVSIYIKSSFRGNPRGAGEAAAVIEFIDKQGKSHKRQQRTQIEADTKNALHLKICIAAMRVLLKPCDIKIYIDCEYMANACRLGWLDKWQQDGWKKANRKPPANVEEWKQFYMLMRFHIIPRAAFVNFSLNNRHYVLCDLRFRSHVLHFRLL